jgi:hypothetical protein
MTYKRNDSIEKKVKRCLDSIGNLHPTLYDRLYEELQQLSCATSVSKLRKKVVEMLQLPTNGKNCKNYWIKRGWSEVESYVKTKEFNKNKKFISPYSREFWIYKINPNTGKNYTTKEADFERNSRRPTKKEYWILKGYSEDDAILTAEKVKIENSKKGVDAYKKTPTEIKKCSNRLSIDYWILRGYSLEESRKKVYENQNKFSLEICVEKYGEERGKTVWEERQKKWQNTLKSKSSEEIEKINKQKNPYRLERFDYIDDLIEKLKLKNIIIFKTEEELIEKIIDDLNKNITKKYWPPKKYIEKLPNIQFEVLKLNKDLFLNKIKYLFTSGPLLLENNGAYKNYIMWVDEGLLRSSYEIYFYEEFKKIDSNSIVSIDQNYPNSRMRYDFYMQNGDYVEICPILTDKSTHVKKIEYQDDFKRKIELFNPIILKTFDDINNYIKKYKNEFITDC